MVRFATRVVYSAPELHEELRRMPSLVQLAQSDPRVDPGYLFQRAAAKRNGGVGVVVYEGVRVAGCLYAIEDRIKGTRSGMFSIGDRTGAGVVLAVPEQRRFVFQQGLRALLSLTRVHTVQINAVSDMFGEHDLADAVADVADHPQVTARESEYTLPNRLRLTRSWGDFLATLGPDTRRNLRRYPRRAERAGIVFKPGIDAPTFRCAFDSIRPHANRWDGVDPAHLDICAENAIRVGLHSADEGWLSVLAGWRHGEHAYIATQMNHAGLPRMSLSMVLRAWLIRELIDSGVREVVFLDGCAGALQLSCVEEPIQRVHIEVHSPLADLSRRALKMLWPRLANRIFRDDPAPLLWRPRPAS